MLILESLSFGVQDGKGQRGIIRELNLTIPGNQFVMTTGPNGDGKSTPAELIIGIGMPMGGQIVSDRTDITQAGITERANTGISYAFQQPVCFKGVQALNLIRLATKKKLSATDVCTYLSEVRLCAKDYVNREVNTNLSGGELKRTEIATVLTRGTKLSVFDELEMGIDLWSFQNLIQVFERMRAKTNDSILIVSYQERILDIADEIVMTADGAITNQGLKDEVLPKLLGTVSAVDACEHRQSYSGKEDG